MWQMLVVQISGCKEIQESGGTVPSFMASKGKLAQGSQRTGCGHHPAWLHMRSKLGTNGGTADSWAGRKNNQYLSPAFGRKPDETFLSQG